MTNINQSIIDDATVAEISEQIWAKNFIALHGMQQQMIIFAKFAELTLKRNGGEAVKFKREQDTKSGWTIDSQLVYDVTRKAEKLGSEFNVDMEQTEQVMLAIEHLTLSPPQTQTVASALEQAAKICDETGKTHTKINAWRNCAFVCSHEIRKLIANPTQEAQGLEQLLYASNNKLKLHFGIDGDVHYVLVVNPKNNKSSEVWYKAKDTARCRVDNFNDAVMLAINEVSAPNKGE